MSEGCLAVVQGHIARPGWTSEGKQKPERGTIGNGVRLSVAAGSEPSMATIHLSLSWEYSYMATIHRWIFTSKTSLLKPWCCLMVHLHLCGITAKWHQAKLQGKRLVQVVGLLGSSPRSTRTSCTFYDSWQTCPCPSVHINFFTLVVILQVPNTRLYLPLHPYQRLLQHLLQVEVKVYNR